MAGTDPKARKTVCRNRKARFTYHIEDVVEAGLVLMGAEVKSLRGGRGSLAESYAAPIGGELWIHQFHIPPYEMGGVINVDPVRPRKLLLHRREIEKLIGAISRKGYTLVPLSVYFRDGRAKLELALARGKQQHDKRHDIKKRDQERDMQRAEKGG